MLTYLGRVLLGCILITCLVVVYLLSVKPSYASDGASQPIAGQNLPRFALVQRISEKLSQPAALDIDSTGRIYILNGDSRVHVFSPKGEWLFSFPDVSIGKVNLKLNGAMDLRIFINL